MRKAGLLLVLLLFGGTVETAYRVREHLGAGPWDWRILTGERFSGPSHAYEVAQTETVPAGTRLEVENRFGGVRVSVGQPGEVKVQLRKVVYQRGAEEARHLADQIRLDTRLAGGVLTVKTNRPELDAVREWRHVGFETHLDLVVPPATVVAVQNEHGPVEVSDVAEAKVRSSYDTAHVQRVAGAVRIDSRHGDVTAASLGGTLALSSRHGNVDVRDVEGAVTAQVEHGDLAATAVGALDVEMRHGDLTAERVKGDLGVRGAHAGVEASDVGGRAVVESSYRDVEVRRVGGDARLVAGHGEVRATDVRGALFAQASYDDVQLTRVQGPAEVRVTHGGVRGEDLAGGLLVRSSGEDVQLDRVQGALDVEAERGGIRVSLAGPLVDRVQLRARHGGIDLDLPAGSRFALEARSVRGEVDVDVPGLLVTERGKRRVIGSLGGGTSPLLLSAEHGDVRVRGAAVAAAVPAEPIARQ